MMGLRVKPAMTMIIVGRDDPARRVWKTLYCPPNNAAGASPRPTTTPPFSKKENTQTADGSSANNLKYQKTSTATATYFLQKKNLP